MDKDTRVLLSLTLEDVRELLKSLRTTDGNSIVWYNRFSRIEDHLNDPVDIHFTNLA